MKKHCFGLILGILFFTSIQGSALAQPAPNPNQAQNSGQPEKQMDTAPAVIPSKSPSGPAPSAAAGPASEVAVPGGEESEESTPPHDALDDYSSIIKNEPTREDQIDEYQLTTIHNLSNLYWKLGMLDVKDDEAIERYLFINDCDLYLKYWHNEFEWNKIKDATRKYLARNMALFPTRFEILIPLAVGKYDQERGRFDITPESQLKNVKKKGCGAQFRGSDMPHDVGMERVSQKHRYSLYQAVYAEVISCEPRTG